jgi:lysyl-tRNA synthetase class 2
MVKSICGTYKIKYHPDGPDAPPVEVDFTPPFKRIPMLAGIEERGGFKVPRPLESDGACWAQGRARAVRLCDTHVRTEANRFLAAKCDELGVQCPPPKTTARLLDKVPLGPLATRDGGLTGTRSLWATSSRTAS